MNELQVARLFDRAVDAGWSGDSLRRAGEQLLDNGHTDWFFVDFVDGDDTVFWRRAQAYLTARCGEIETDLSHDFVRFRRPTQ